MSIEIRCYNIKVSIAKHGLFFNSKIVNEMGMKKQYMCFSKKITPEKKASINFKNTKIMFKSIAQKIIVSQLQKHSRSSF